MDRKWRLNRGAINTVLSFPAFCEQLVPLKEGYDLASLTDLYAVYTVLHIESKEWEVRWSPEGEFYYFLAKEIVTKKPQAAVPEGDEDMPAPMLDSEMPEGGEGDGDEEGTLVDRFLNKIEAAEFSGEDEPEDLAEREDEAEEEPEEEAAKEPSPAAPQIDTEKPKEPKIRTQLLVPVSSASTKLTPALLQRFFRVRGVQVQQLILGLVDSNGVVTRCCLYNYIQEPLGGPGQANLELLDD